MSKFVDAQEMARRHPETFEAPSPGELAALRPGDSVKICADDKERFWVELTEVDGDRLAGWIDNDLVRTHLHGLRYKDPVTFEARHVYQILTRQ